MKKIPFDIKFRPEIESGKYSVQTRDGRKARIICWDRKDNTRQIVVLVENYKEQEIMHLFNLEGRILEHYTSDSDLVILTDEPELSEFEELLRQAVVETLSGETPDGSGGTISWAVALSDDDVKKLAPRLLDLARKELHDELYCKGYQEGFAAGEKEAFDKYKYIPVSVPTYFAPCYYGGPCTNPQHDCINCPRQSGDGINTATGTSTSKLEG